MQPEEFIEKEVIPRIRCRKRDARSMWLKYNDEKENNSFPLSEFKDEKERIKFGTPCPAKWWDIKGWIGRIEITRILLLGSYLHYQKKYSKNKKKEIRTLRKKMSIKDQMIADQANTEDIWW